MGFSVTKLIASISYFRCKSESHSMELHVFHGLRWSKVHFVMYPYPIVNLKLFLNSLLLILRKVQFTIYTKSDPKK